MSNFYLFYSVSTLPAPILQPEKVISDFCSVNWWLCWGCCKTVWSTHWWRRLWYQWRVGDGREDKVCNNPILFLLKLLNFRALYSTAQNRSSSSQSVNTLMRSGSSSKIRGLFSSVIHGSGSSLNVSTFKSNLMAHLQRRDSGNFDPGVDDDSSSEYSEYDD